MDSNKNDYILKEAEAILADCMVKFEGKQTNIRQIKKVNNMEKKYKSLKLITKILGVLLILSAIFNFI